MAVNFTAVTQGSPIRGWTAGSISPRPQITGPVANIGTSGNIPSNILQAIGNLNAEQAFRQFLGNQIFGSAMSAPAATMPMVVNPADALQAQSAQAQRQAEQRAATNAAQQLSLVNQNLLNYPTGFGGISPMGLGAPRAALQQQQFNLQSMLSASPKISGWNSAAFPLQVI